MFSFSLIIPIWLFHISCSIFCIIERIHFESMYEHSKQYMYIKRLFTIVGSKLGTLVYGCLREPLQKHSVLLLLLHVLQHLYNVFYFCSILLLYGKTFVVQYSKLCRQSYLVLLAKESGSGKLRRERARMSKAMAASSSVP